MKAVLLIIAAAALTAPAAAVPPPPSPGETPIVLPPDQCAAVLNGTVRAYAAPAFGFDVAAPTVLRLLSTTADPALLIDLEQGDQRPVAMGAGLAGGDIRIGIAAPGRYRLRVLMTGDAARTGRAIDFRINLSRAMESGAAECARPAALPD